MKRQEPKYQKSSTKHFSSWYPIASVAGRVQCSLQEHSQPPCIIRPTSMAFATCQTIALPIHHRPLLTTHRHHARRPRSPCPRQRYAPHAQVGHQPASKPSATTTPDVWLDNWYPVAWTADLSSARPYAFTLFDRAYVTFETAARCYAVLDDCCAHRSAPLSEGRVFTREDTGERVLECPYHGWRYAECGRCVDIPQLPLNAAVPRSTAVPSYPVAVLHDLLFVWPGEETHARDAPPPPAGLPGVGATPFIRYARRLPLNFVTVLENLVDPSHAHWAHHNVLSKRSRAPRHASLHVRPRSVGVFDAAVRYTDDAQKRGPEFRFVAPVHFVNIATDVPMPGSRMHLLAWVRPTSRDDCELFTINIVERANVLIRLIAACLPRWLACQVGHAVTDGDTPILRRQMERLQHGRRDPVGSAWKEDYGLAVANWDGLVIAMRKWFDAHAAQLPSCWQGGPPLPVMSKRDANDRFHQHTEHCAACSTAFRYARAIAWGAALVAAFAAVAFAAGIACVACVPADLSGLWRARRRFLIVTLVLAGLATACWYAARRVICNMTYSERSYELSHMP